MCSDSRKRVGLTDEPSLERPEDPSTIVKPLGVDVPNVIPLALCLLPVGVETRYKVLSPKISLDLFRRHGFLGDAPSQKLRIQVSL